MDFDSLTKLEMNSTEFMKYCMDYNLKHLDFKSSTNSSSFYTYMEGLLKFGRLLNPSYKPLQLYKRALLERIQIFAIDLTGLSHGFIYGPITDVITDYKSRHQIIDPFYGADLIIEKNTYVYNCFEKVDFETKIAVEPVDLKMLRDNFLPLTRGGRNNKTYTYYFKSNDRMLSEKYGPTIYRSVNRSFYLPFIELISTHLELDGWTLRINPTYEEENISFQADYFWNSRKNDHWKRWEGKISYETFEIIEIKLINEESIYNW